MEEQTVFFIITVICIIGLVLLVSGEKPTYSLAEYNHVKGKCFLFFGAVNALGGEETATFGIMVGDNDVVINEAVIQSASKFISWNWHEGINIDLYAATELPEIKRNASVNSTSNCKVYLNPGISGGQQLLNSKVDVHGVSVSDSSSYIRETIIRQPYTLKKNTNYAITITNRENVGKNIELIVNLYNS